MLKSKEQMPLKVLIFNTFTDRVILYVKRTSLLYICQIFKQFLNVKHSDFADFKEQLLFTFTFCFIFAVSYFLLRQAFFILPPDVFFCFDLFFFFFFFCANFWLSRFKPFSGKAREFLQDHLNPKLIIKSVLEKFFVATLG